MSVAAGGNKSKMPPIEAELTSWEAKVSVYVYVSIQGVCVCVN